MRNKSFVISLLVLLSTLGFVVGFSSRGHVMVVKMNLENIPMVINGYEGTEDYFSDAVYEELNADKHLYRHYRNGEGEMIDLYIGYYGTSKGGRTPHNPYACLSGAGWAVLESRQVIIKCDYYPEGAKINYMLTNMGNLYQIVFHWYQSAGTKVLSSGLRQNVWRFINRIKNNRNDGAFLRVSILSERDDVPEAEVLAKSFSEEVLNLLPDHWPEER